MNEVVGSLGFVRHSVCNMSAARQVEWGWMSRRGLDMTGAHTRRQRNGGGGGAKQDKWVDSKTGVEQKKIDDLMEVWRQWAARRGIGEAAGEGIKITHDGWWTPTRSGFDKWARSERETKRFTFSQLTQFLHMTESDHLLLLCHSANDI